MPFTWEDRHGCEHGKGRRVAGKWHKVYVMCYYHFKPKRCMKRWCPRLKEK